MKVAYDDEIFVQQRRGGISRVFSELIREFRDDPAIGVDPVFDFGISRNDHLSSLEPSGVRTIPAGSVMDRRRIAQVINERLPHRQRPTSDVLHLTFYGLRSLRRSGGRPVVCSLHDMIPELHPDLSGSSAHGDKLRVLRHCDLILCGSETARADLESLVHGLDAEIRVCPYGTRPRPTTAPSTREATTVLYVGGRSGYKNFGVLLDALGLAPMTGLQLICVGGGPFTNEELDKISSLGDSIRVRQVEADDAALEQLYRGATLFVATSLAEGFGLPVLEAMSAGCPVAVSDIAAFREVVGGAGLFHHPREPDALAQNIRTVLSSDTIGAEFSELGRARSTSFTWRRTAELTAEAYRALLS